MAKIRLYPRLDDFACQIEDGREKEKRSENHICNEFPCDVLIAAAHDVVGTDGTKNLWTFLSGRVTDADLGRAWQIHRGNAKRYRERVMDRIRIQFLARLLYRGLFVGGCTVDPQRFGLEIDEKLQAYTLSLPDRRVVFSKLPSLKKLVNYLQKIIPEIDKDSQRLFLGSWRDPDSEKCYVDISILVHEQQDARKVA